MRVIILHFLDIQSKHNSTIVKALSDGAAGSGHIVDVVDGNRSTETLRLTPYEYVVILSPSYGLFKGKIPARVTEVLSSCGNLTGKKGAAFVTKALFSAPSSNQGEHYIVQTPQAGFVYPGIASKISADGFKFFLWSHIWTDSDFPPSSSKPSLRFSPFVCSRFFVNAFPHMTFPADHWLRSFHLVL